MPRRSRAHRLTLALAAALFGALATAPSALAAAQPPAAGAGLDQVALATGMATVASAILLWVCVSHRNGRIKWLGKLAAFAERETGTAGWSSLPGAMLGIALLTAVFGMYWDISLHIDNGRDPGPLANPAHYFILAGLFGVLAAGVLSVALTGDEKPSKAAVRLPNGWWAPLGAIVVMTCGAVSLLAFPLDDIWHRLFGQDVTLWGPTHLLLIGGASFSILGQWILDVEGRHAAKAPAREGSIFTYVRNVSLVGSLLIGLSTFQAEFDYSVPQFRLVWQPLLLALAAGIGLTAARVRLGRGGALAAALFFIGLRGLLSLLVGPIFGETTPHFPLYIVEAGLVELVALRWNRTRPITLGAISGVLIGTVGFAAEYAWSNIVDTIGWPPSLIVEGVICAVVAGVGGRGQGESAALGGASRRHRGARRDRLGHPDAERHAAQGHPHAHTRRAARHAPAGERAGQARPAERRRQRALVRRHGVAGQDALDRRPDEEGRPRPLALREADPGRRSRLEGDAAAADRPRRAWAAALPARGQGDPRQEGPGEERADDHLRARQAAAPA
jgi:hypothetical protein